MEENKDRFIYIGDKLIGYCEKKDIEVKNDSTYIRQIILISNRITITPSKY